MILASRFALLLLPLAIAACATRAATPPVASAPSAASAGVADAAFAGAAAQSGRFALMAS